MTRVLLTSAVPQLRVLFEVRIIWELIKRTNTRIEIFNSKY